MKTKTFTNYLRDTVRGMTKDNTLSFVKIENQAKSNTRLGTLFSLYALFDKETLNKLEEQKKKYPLLYKLYSERKTEYKNILNAELSDKYMDLNEFDELRKTYSMYLNTVVNKVDNQKKLYLDKILELQSIKRISNYRIYKDLGLNPGNTNDFLRNNMYKKMSVKNTRTILNYCQSF